MAAFTPGNIVVVRVGDGGAGLSGAAAAVFLEEYTPGGRLVQTIALPAGGNGALTISGSSGSEGFLNLSTNGQYLFLAGYNAVAGTASVAATSSAGVPRVVGRVGIDGSVDTTTTTTSFSGGSIRSASSTDGSQIWLAGSNTGVVTTTLGASGTGTVVANTPTTLRVIDDYAGQLYVTAQSGTIRVATVGTGTPTAPGATITNIPGIPTTGSPYGFFFADLTTAVAGIDTLYVADDSSGVGGLFKYSLVNGAWAANGSVAGPVRGLTGTSSGSTADLYVTTAGSTTTTANTIVRFVDPTGYNGQLSGSLQAQGTVIATAAANTVFRGVAFAPRAATTETIFLSGGLRPDRAEDSTAQGFTYFVTRTGSTAAAATVTWTVTAASGTTTLDAADFGGVSGGALPSGTATFAVGSDRATIVVPVSADKLIEPTEGFVVTLSAPSAGYVLGNTTGNGRIINDDVGGTFTIVQVSDAAEGGTATFTISRTGGDGGPVTIGYTVGAGTTGTSADAADFGGGFPSGSVTFAPGETSTTIAIATAQDAAPEGDERFTVSLGNPSAGGLGTVSSAEGVILANDPAGSVSVADVRVDEGAGVATITLTRTDGTGAITVGYQTGGGSATAGEDYTTTSGTATFAEGATTATFDVPILNDNADEPDETFTVTLTAGAGNPAIGQGTATVTIVDNDEPAAVGSFAITPATRSVTEGNAGTVQLTFTVTRSDGTAGAASVPYSVSFTGANPADAADFADGQAFSGSVLFGDGDAEAKTVTLLVRGDSELEADETVTVALGTPTAGTLGAQTSAVGTVVNDDSRFSVAAASGREADGVRFTVTRAGDASGAATLSWTAATGAAGTADAADFGGAFPTGTVVFEAGATSATFLVPVADDAAIERDESFAVTLSGAGAGQTIATPTAAGTILNDDFPALSIADASVIEGNDGTATLTFTVTASAPAGPGGISFRASTADGTAAAASDYGALQNVLGTIAEGQTSATVTVGVGGDTTFERNETLTVTLSGATNATIARAVATGTIVNDEPVPAAARLFETAFNDFAAAGFSPGATAASGQLDSNVWRVVGLSAQPNPAYGFTGPGGNTTAATDDFGRGLITGSADPASAGVYAPAANRALVVQPTGAELEAGGFIEARIQNTSGATATSFDVAFDWAYRNSADRSSSLQLAYSTDGVTYTTVPDAAFSTPGTAPRAANGTTIVVPTAFSTQAETATITGTVADGGYLYLRWIHASSAGSGSRDEVGIDNLVVDARLSATPTAAIADVSVAEGNGGERFATFTVTRSNGTAEASVAYATIDGTAVAGRDYGATSGTLSFAVGEVSKTIQVAIVGDAVREADERFQVVLSNPVGFEVPQPRATATITNDDTGPVAIYDIQGLGHTSPFAGQTVATAGVVTALAANGFYLQDAVGDGLIGTSDGIFVFTDAAPTVTVGNAITLSGTVEESRGHAGALTLTRLAAPTAITVTNPSAPLPAATVIATDGSGRAAPTQVIDDDGLTSFDPTTDGIDFYESLEGMLVTIQAPRVVADTTSVGVTYVVASDGVGATGLNSRSGMTISAGDTNPETIQIFRGGTYTQGDKLNDVTGVLTYFSSASTTSGSYQVNPTATVTAALDTAHPARETTTLTGTASGLTYASFNVENLGPVATRVAADTDATYAVKQAAVDARFATHASEVVGALGNPDVIGLQEIQDADGENAGGNLSGAASAQKLIDAIAAAGGPTYRYVEVAPPATNISGGAPNGNIRNGFLFNPSRVSYVEDSARALPDAIYNGTRRPLVADFQFNGQVFTAIDLHSTSRGGSGVLYGSAQPPVQAGDGARTAQADAVKAYVAGVLANDPNHLFVVNGDFNGFPYETALNNLAPVDGTGALVNLINALPVEERYTYYFDGYYQSFDNVIVSRRLAAGSSIDVVHYNAGYTDGRSATDHDQPVALIGLARTGGQATAVADSFATTAASVLRATVLANDTGGDASLTVTAINGQTASTGSAVRLTSGALLTLTAGGGFAYDPDGAYAGLGSGQTATDSFTYTLTGGSTATATITVSGVAAATANGQGQLQGTSGNDSYGGTAAADYFDLAAGGNDQVAGGAGDDAFFFGGALTGADRVNGGSGMDQVGLQGSYTGANRLVLTATTLSEVEVIAALPGGSYDLVLADGVVGASGKFTVYGSELGTGEALSVDGSAVRTGSLEMYGGLGVDTLVGGGGNDGFYFGPDRWGATDRVTGGGGGNDQIALDGDYTLTVDARMDAEVLVLLPGPANDRNSFAITTTDGFVAAGATKTIYAVDVTTPVVIDAAAETDGAFRFFGGLAADTITGGAGADRFFGGAGGDTLRGGGGADLFVYDDASQSTGLGYDRLLDFDIGVDRIEITGQVHDTYRSVAGGDLSDPTFTADLQAAVGAQLTGGAAVFFTVTGGGHAGETFLVVDANGIDGYQEGGDYVFQLPAAPAVGVTPPDFIIA